MPIQIYIDDMWVDSQHMGNGYGKAVLYELECLFQNNGFDI